MFTDQEPDDLYRHNQFDRYILIPTVAATGMFVAERFIAGTPLSREITLLSIFWLIVFQLLGRMIAEITIADGRPFKPAVVIALPTVLATIGLIGVNQLLISLPLPDSIAHLLRQLMEPFRVVTLALFSLLNIFEQLLHSRQLSRSPRKRILYWVGVMAVSIMLFQTASSFSPFTLPILDFEPMATGRLEPTGAIVEADATKQPARGTVAAIFPSTNLSPTPILLTPAPTVQALTAPSTLLVDECTYADSWEHLYLYESPVFTKPVSGRVEVPPPYEIISIEWASDARLAVSGDILHRIVIWHVSDYAVAGTRAKPLACLLRTEQWLHMGGPPTGQHGTFVYHLQNVQINENEEIIRHITPLSDAVLFITWR